MTERTLSIAGSRRVLVILAVAVVVVTALVIFFRGSIYRVGRESRMQRTITAHYEILNPPGAFSPGGLASFASEREKIFVALDGKLGGAASHARIHVVLDPEFEPGAEGRRDHESSYQVHGTTIRSKLAGASADLPAAADAEAMLNAAWGPPGNAEIGRWAGIALSGDWRGTEIGMAAAAVEQQSGHQTIANMLNAKAASASTIDGREILGGAWISSVAEFGGATAVRKLYSTRMDEPSVAEAAKALGTTPPELDRRWQLYMYSYLAGMPGMGHDSSMPMNMPMGEGH